MPGRVPMSNAYAVIMAGGRGERFWPLSTELIPKPFIPLLGPKSLIQRTVERLLPLIPPERILISIGEAHLQIAATQLPQIPERNFLIEPVGRDTAACLGYCALHIEGREPDGIMLAIPADHFVGDEVAYRSVLEKGLVALPGATGVVFGIHPTRPETGYGYIQVAGAVPGLEALPVLRFVEKPSADRAAQYLASGDYFWNSGIFLWANRTLLELIRLHMPEMDRGLAALRPFLGQRGRQSELHGAFAALPRISIDFGVMEKTSGLRLVPAAFAWDDIGNWGALERALPADTDGNVACGEHTSVESSGCITYSDAGPITTFGACNLIVVQANGQVLVCDKSRAADLKRLLACVKPTS